MGFVPGRDYGFLTTYAGRRAMAQSFRLEVADELSRRGASIGWDIAAMRARIAMGRLGHR